ncbi:MAG: hypothetical protein IJ264_00060 [Clostridia bacterium]|nr:hypothetical protein [Clostridia bacterium]
MFADKASLTMSETMFVAVVGLIVVILELAILAVLIVLLSKIFRAIEGRVSSASDEPVAASDAPSAAPAAAVPAASPVAQPAAVAVPAGGIRLIDVDERTAAVVMALVSHQSGIPLERLSFRSIRCLAPAGLELEGVDENTVEAIIAIISNESGIPIERLSFKSIKKVEE